MCELVMSSKIAEISHPPPLLLLICLPLFILSVPAAHSSHYFYIYNQLVHSKAASVSTHVCTRP